MKPHKIYIQAAEQISIQEPLSEKWMDEPIFYHDPMVKAINPVFRDYISGSEVRRMGGILKRALVTTLKVLETTGIEHPDAIITGTNFGCLEYSEKFLENLIENEEEMLSPTYFMQSTHNTVGSTLGIYTKSHGYNTTYSQGNMSFELCLQDAWMQMQLGMISNALVGGHDEMTEPVYEVRKCIGYLGKSGMAPCGEVSMSMMLNAAEGEHLCEFAGVFIAHKPSVDTLQNQLQQMLVDADLTMQDISAVMIGKNGNPANDCYYDDVIEALFAQKPLLHYKHLFGENYTISALGFYAAAHCLKKGFVPEALYDEATPCRCESLHSILLINQIDGRNYSLVLLKR